MKRQIKYLSVPIHIWTHSDLSLEERAVMIEIDSYSDSNGCACGVQALASSLGLPSKTIKATLKSLQSKGALEVRIDEDGLKRMFVYLYKERYVENPNAVIVGDKPSDVETIDYQLIQDTWNSTCDKLSRIDKFTARRKQKTRTCLKGASATLNDMIKVIRLVATSAFLNGSKTDWQCSYDWVIKSPDNFTKIIEGQYHKDYGERRAYETIMQGGEISQQSKQEDDYYR